MHRYFHPQIQSDFVERWCVYISRALNYATPHNYQVTLYFIIGQESHLCTEILKNGHHGLYCFSLYN